MDPRANTYSPSDGLQMQFDAENFPSSIRKVTDADLGFEYATRWKRTLHYFLIQSVLLNVLHEDKQIGMNWRTFNKSSPNYKIHEHDPFGVFETNQRTGETWIAYKVDDYGVEWPCYGVPYRKNIARNLGYIPIR